MPVLPAANIFKTLFNGFSTTLTHLWRVSKFILRIGSFFSLIALAPAILHAYQSGNWHVYHSCVLMSALARLCYPGLKIAGMVLLNI